MRSDSNSFQALTEGCAEHVAPGERLVAGGITQQSAYVELDGLLRHA